jgi:hypothetical protein
MIKERPKKRSLLRNSLESSASLRRRIAGGEGKEEGRVT